MISMLTRAFTLDVLGLILLCLGLGLGFSIVSVIIGMAVGISSAGLSCLLLSYAGDKR